MARKSKQKTKINHKIDYGKTNQKRRQKQTIHIPKVQPNLNDVLSQTEAYKTAEAKKNKSYTVPRLGEINPEAIQKGLNIAFGHAPTAQFIEEFNTFGLSFEMTGPFDDIFRGYSEKSQTFYVSGSNDPALIAQQIISQVSEIYKKIRKSASPRCPRRGIKKIANNEIFKDTRQAFSMPQFGSDYPQEVEDIIMKALDRDEDGYLAKIINETDITFDFDDDVTHMGCTFNFEKGHFMLDEYSNSTTSLLKTVKNAVEKHKIFDDNSLISHLKGFKTITDRQTVAQLLNEEEAPAAESQGEIIHVFPNKGATKPVPRIDPKRRERAQRLLNSALEDENTDIYCNNINQSGRPITIKLGKKYFKKDRAATSGFDNETDIIHINSLIENDKAIARALSFQLAQIYKYDDWEGTVYENLHINKTVIGDFEKKDIITLAQENKNDVAIPRFGTVNPEVAQNLFKRAASDGVLNLGNLDLLNNKNLTISFVEKTPCPQDFPTYYDDETNHISIEKGSEKNPDTIVTFKVDLKEAIEKNSRDVFPPKWQKKKVDGLLVPVPTQ